MKWWGWLERCDASFHQMDCILQTIGELTHVKVWKLISLCCLSPKTNSKFHGVGWRKGDAAFAADCCEPFSIFQTPKWPHLLLWEEMLKPFMTFSLEEMLHSRALCSDLRYYQEHLHAFAFRLLFFLMLFHWGDYLSDLWHYIVLIESVAEIFLRHGKVCCRAIRFPSTWGWEVIFWFMYINEQHNARIKEREGSH